MRIHPPAGPALLEARIRQAHLNGRRVLHDLSLSLWPGEIVALIGPNGAGKSTLMRALAGLVPVEGSVDLAGRPLASWAGEARARLLAYLPQEARIHWPMPVRRVVALGRIPWLDWTARLSPADEEAIAEAMRLTATTRLAERSAARLSAGEKARVLLARALAGRPRVLLADEPVAALDPYYQMEILGLLQHLAREREMAVLVSLHDLTLAARHAARVLLLDRGKLVAQGRPGAVLTPAHLARVYRIAVAETA
ncbi:MAG: ABC transporter ATP-binding protein, partial [Alphaproteobacteria bacterium]